MTSERLAVTNVQPHADARGLSLVVERRGVQGALGYAQAELRRRLDVGELG